MLKSRSQFCFLLYTGNILSDKQSKKALSAKVSKVGSDNETFVNVFLHEGVFQTTSYPIFKLTPYSLILEWYKTVQFILLCCKGSD